MSAPGAGGSRRSPKLERGSRAQNIAGSPQGQCMPMPLPTVGTQMIIQGNGTDVGTVILLQCPEKHRLVGKDLTCVMGSDGPEWIGETYCKSLPSFGFHVALAASIVSSAIILLMSMAFIACCVHDCTQRQKRRKQERATELWCQDEFANRYFHSHRGGYNNYNNNNGHENPALRDDERWCQRCPSDITVPPPGAGFEPEPLISPLPGQGYDPLSARSTRRARDEGPVQQALPAPLRAPAWGPAAGSGAGLAQLYREQGSWTPLLNRPAATEPGGMSKTPTKGGSTRIMSV